MYLQSVKSVKHNAAKSVNRSFLKKSRHIGFGVFIVQSSMGRLHWKLKHRARICRSFKKTRYRFSAWRAGTKPYLSYWPARLHRLAKSIPQNRFLGSINNYKYGLRGKKGRCTPYILALLADDGSEGLEQRVLNEL